MKLSNPHHIHKCRTVILFTHKETSEKVIFVIVVLEMGGGGGGGGGGGAPVWFLCHACKNLDAQSCLTHAVIKTILCIQYPCDFFMCAAYHLCSYQDYIMHPISL